MDLEITRIRDYIEKTFIHGLRNDKNKGLYREDLYSWT